MEKRVRTFGRVSEHGLLTSIQELDDLIAYEQMPSIVEVEPIFENEFVKPFGRDHPENVDNVDARSTSSFFAEFHHSRSSTENRDCVPRSRPDIALGRARLRSLPYQ